MKLLHYAFEKISGHHKIDFYKSEVYYFGEVQEVMDQYDMVFGCNLEIFSMSYLWTPIHVRNPRNEDWEKVDEHFGKRLLSIWKRNHMSTGGHLTLRNSMLSSIPLYMMPFFAIPKGVLKKFYYFRSIVFFGKVMTKRESIALPNGTYFVSHKVKGVLEFMT